MVFAFLRNSSSRAISPASIVFPSPVSSAMNRFTRGQTQGLAQGLHLVGVDLDAGAEGGLEQVGVGRRDAVPAQGVEEGGELPRRVEPFRREIGPALFLEDQAVDLVVPVDLEALALGVVVSAGETHERGCRSVGYHLLDQPAAGANQDQLTRFRGFFGQAIYK